MQTYHIHENDHNSNDVSAPISSPIHTPTSPPLKNSSFHIKPHSKTNIKPNTTNKLLNSMKNKDINRKILIRKTSHNVKSIINVRATSNLPVENGDNDTNDLSTVVNHKKNKEFHNFFDSMPDTEILINDYGCALQKEILAQGRIYVSKNFICFHANIFGWVTKEIISYSEITSIEKKTSAFVIPNAILITTKSSKEYFFTSFLSRDTVYGLLVRQIKNKETSHGKVKDKIILEENILENSTYNGEEGHKTVNCLGNENNDIRKAIKRNISLRLKNLSNGKIKRTILMNDSGSLYPDSLFLSSLTKSIRKTKSAAELFRNNNNDNGNCDNDNCDNDNSNHIEDNNNSENNYDNTNNDNNNYAKKTDCECLKNNQQHNGHIVLDTQLPGTIEKIYNLLFKSKTFAEFVTNHEITNEYLNVSFGEWMIGEDGRQVCFGSYTTSFPDSFKIGPKTTKVYLKDNLIHCDFTNYGSLITSAGTPDVLSDDSFTMTTRTCLMCSGSNRTRIIVSCMVNFTKNYRSKGTIERALVVSQSRYYNTLEKAIRNYIASNSSEFVEQPSLSTSKKSQIHSSEFSSKSTSSIISNLSSLLLLSFSPLTPTTLSFSPSLSSSSMSSPSSIHLSTKSIFKPEVIILVEFLAAFIGYLYILYMSKELTKKIDDFGYCYYDNHHNSYKEDKDNNNNDDDVTILPLSVVISLKNRLLDEIRRDSFFGQR